MLNSQSRPAISQLSTQQLANMPAGALVSAQYEFHTAAGSMSAEKDLALCDADDAAFQLALPTTDDAILGKAYIVRETGGTNAVTLTTPGAETIDGATTFVVAAGTSACVVLVQSAAGVKSWVSLANAGSGGTGFLVDGVGTVDATNMAADSVETAAIVDLNVTTGKLASASVTPLKLSSSEVAPAANAACAILATTTSIRLTITDATVTAISTTAAEPGQWVTITCGAAAGGGSYTLAVTGGTVTFDATNEKAIVRRNHGDTAWEHFSLIGATFA